MAYSSEYFAGINEGKSLMITFINLTITDFKKGATKKQIKWLDDLQKEIDSCSDI